VKTNQNSWQFLYGTSDTSMDRVSEISATYFDFGALPKTNTQSTDNTVTDSNTTTTEDTSFGP